MGCMPISSASLRACRSCSTVRHGYMLSSIFYCSSWQPLFLLFCCFCGLLLALSSRPSGRSLSDSADQRRAPCTWYCHTPTYSHACCMPRMFLGRRLCDVNVCVRPLYIEYGVAQRGWRTIHSACARAHRWCGARSGSPQLSTCIPVYALQGSARHIGTTKIMVSPYRDHKLFAKDK